MLKGERYVGCCQKPFLGRHVIVGSAAEDAWTALNAPSFSTTTNINLSSALQHGNQREDDLGLEIIFVYILVKISTIRVIIPYSKSNIYAKPAHFQDSVCLLQAREHGVDGTNQDRDYGR